MVNTQLHDHQSLGTNEVQIEMITRGAERQLRRLAPMDRQSVVEMLSAPIRGDLLKPVGNLAAYRVVRFSVPGSTAIRVSYRPIAGKACVVHIGNHDEFDFFSLHYDGRLPTRFIPLKESKVMNKSQSNGHAQKGSTAHFDPKAGQPDTGSDNGRRTNAFSNGVRPLSDVLFHLFEELVSTMENEKKAMLDDVEADIVLHGEKFEEEMKPLLAQVSKQERVLADVRASIAKISPAYAERLGQVERQTGELHAAQQAIETRLDQRDDAVKCRLDGITGQLAPFEALAASLAELSGTVDQLRSELADHLAEKTTVTWSAKVQESLTSFWTWAVRCWRRVVSNQFARGSTKSESIECGDSCTPALAGNTVAAVSRRSTGASLSMSSVGDSGPDIASICSHSEPTASGSVIDAGCPSGTLVR